MSVSAVLEQLIHKLGLGEFPCGPGPWKQSSDQCSDTQSLLDLLDCPASPWHQDPDWSPQAGSLRKLAALSPKQLSKSTIYRHFSVLHIIDKDVSVLDVGLLKLCNLEELVLSANRLQEVPSELLPTQLKVLELRNNHVTSLSSLTSQPPPGLLYLGLASNPLGSPHDVSGLTGAHWPALVGLDLSCCDFEDQSLLLEALSSLPSLRSLLLEGNPCTLGPSYPGLTLDVLQGLLSLDKQWISPEEREDFKGMAELSGAVRESARAAVHVGRLRGLPDPEQSLDLSSQSFPLLSFNYCVSYDFISDSPTLLRKKNSIRSESGDAAEVKDAPESGQSTEDPSVSGHCSALVSSHSSSKLAWSESMDFSESHRHRVSDLRALKSFLGQGMTVRVHEEKILSWPAASEDSATTKGAKGAKGKDPPNKPGSTKGRDKKRRVLPELVQEAPVRRLLGSVHLPLHRLLLRGHQGALCCDFGTLQPESPPPADTPDKDEKKVKKEKKEEIKTGSAKKIPFAKGKVRSVKSVKEVKEVQEEVGVSGGRGLQEPLTLELRVCLERWQSVAEARQELEASDLTSAATDTTARLTQNQNHHQNQNQNQNQHRPVTAGSTRETHVDTSRTGNSRAPSAARGAKQ